MNSLQQVSVTSEDGRATVAPLRIRGRSFPTVVLQMTDGAGPEFYEALDFKLAQAPRFFHDVPFVLDLNQAPGISRPSELVAMTRELRARNLTLIGIQNGTDEQNRAALAAGLITLQGGRDIPVGDERRAHIAPVAPEPPRSGTMIVTEPVRSGQRVFADGGDLVVVSSVSSGAEVIARGNIHIYGRMHGRALAGANGDTKARIFCQSLEAELIAIAGLYMTCDEITTAVRKQRVQVFLKDDALHIEPLK